MARRHEPFAFLRSHRSAISDHPCPYDRHSLLSRNSTDRTLVDEFNRRDDYSRRLATLNRHFGRFSSRCNKFGVTVICILSFWKDPASQTIMFFVALGLIGLNGSVVMYQNSKSIIRVAKKMSMSSKVTAKGKLATVNPQRDYANELPS